MLDPFMNTLFDECRRRQLGYSELAKLCGASRNSVYLWFNGGNHTTLATARRLAKALGFKLVLEPPKRLVAPLDNPWPMQRRKPRAAPVKAKPKAAKPKPKTAKPKPRAKRAAQLERLAA